MHIWTFLLLVLVAARLTRLVTADTLTLPLRARAARRDHLRHEHRRQLGLDPGRSRCHDFVTCSWCIGTWISLILFAAAYACPTIGTGPTWHQGLEALGYGLAASYLVGYFARHTTP